MRRILLSGAMIVVAAGCSSSNPPDRDLEAWTREVRVMTPQQIGDREYEEVANLEETESLGAFGEEQAVRTAKDRLRRRAAKLDADAVVIVACGQNVRPVEPDHLRTAGPEVVCRGVAIRWTSN